MLIGGVQIVESRVIRFVDSHEKLRPAIVLAVLASLESVLVIEGTSQASWKDSGIPVLLEVAPRSRFQQRMGLSSSVTTYFYKRDIALLLLPKRNIRVSVKRSYSCPESELRKMQRWAFDRLKDSSTPESQITAQALSDSLRLEPGFSV